MTWKRIASGIYASHPAQVEGSIRVVAGLKDIVALMREEQSEPKIIVTNVAGGSAVSTIIRRAKAIVSTIGGPKSHIVVVARDYNLPCIVGASGLDLADLEDGTLLRMNEDGSIERSVSDSSDGAADASVAAGAAASAGSATDMARNVDTDDLRLLRAIAFAGAVEDAESLVGFGDDVKSRLSRLRDEGLVETDGVILLTAAGEEALAEWYGADRSKLSDEERDALHAEFRPLDRELKAVASAWQDADDADNWDQRLQAIEALTALHESTLAFLDRYIAVLPRLEEFRARLIKACENVLDGETEYFVSVRVDSYHTAWFSLHEDLLRLLERERDPE